MSEFQTDGTDTEKARDAKLYLGNDRRYTHKVAVMEH